MSDDAHLVQYSVHTGVHQVIIYVDEIHSVDCYRRSKIDCPPWIGFSLRECTFSTVIVSSVTTAVIGQTRWIATVFITEHAALIRRSV